MTNPMERLQSLVQRGLEHSVKAGELKAKIDVYKALRDWCDREIARVVAQVEVLQRRAKDLGKTDE